MFIALVLTLTGAQVGIEIKEVSKLLLATIPAVFNKIKNRNKNKE